MHALLALSASDFRGIFYFVTILFSKNKDCCYNCTLQIKENMEESNVESKKALKNETVLRCAKWLQEQNSINKTIPDDLESVYTSSTVADISVRTVPTAVDEEDYKPIATSAKYLRKRNLRFECQWPSCHLLVFAYEEFQKHVATHLKDVEIIKMEDENEDTIYVCLWDICRFKTPDYLQIVRHIHYHAYHAKLLAIGFNARATLNLKQCKKDSTHRNQLPELKSELKCRWYKCEKVFSSYQEFLNHVKTHLDLKQKFMCSWAGCGTVYSNKNLLEIHVRSHTGERLLACYHCGRQFSLNRKLRDHINRQHAKNSGLVCSVCGAPCATEYLLREHYRLHVSVHVCAYCDMSMPTLSTLAAHTRDRHSDVPRQFPCPLCPYRAKHKRHLNTHMKSCSLKHGKENPKKKCDFEFAKPKKEEAKKYCCHICPEDAPKIFSRGHPLSKHLVNEHGTQLPDGHCKFRYQKSSDGMYRLITTRLESLEAYTEIMERQGKLQCIPRDIDVKVVDAGQMTKRTPVRLRVLVNEEESGEKVVEQESDTIEITMCDVDEHGNVVVSRVYRQE